MKKTFRDTVRPVARRHQTYRILSRRRKPVLKSVTVHQEKPQIKVRISLYPDRHAALIQRNRHNPRVRRLITPATRTRRRRLYVLRHQNKPDAFDTFEKVLQDVSRSAQKLALQPPQPVDDTQVLPVITETVPASVTWEKKTHRKWWLWTAAVALIIAATGLYAYHRSVPVQPAVTHQEVSMETQQPSVPPSPTPVPSPLTTQLEPQIEAALSPLEGEWSCYVKDLSTGETIMYNSHKQHSASLIKLYTAGCYEQELKDGVIQATSDSENDEAEMISLSDNDAWVRLETAIGQGSYAQGYTSVLHFARSHGFPDTGRLVDKNDNFAGYGGNNWTSVQDTGNCLDQIYNGTYISPEASAKILNLMKQQAHVNKIPAGLPAGTVCANKTGELNLTQNDAAIVYGPKTNYILVVMSDGMENGDEAVQHIIDLSSMVYQFLEN